MFTLSLAALLGICGLAIDIGRMYVAKSESQSFVDAAAVNAVVSLATNPGGFVAAANAASLTSKMWAFGTVAFSNVVTTFGTSSTDTFIASPPGAGQKASDYKFVKVSVTISVPLYLIEAVVKANAASVSAESIAGQDLITHLPGGEFPFSPYSRKNASPDDSNDPFGFKVGAQYTMRWEPPGNKTSCGTDEGNVGQNGSFRGYCCTGGQSVGSIRDVLAGGGTVPIKVGDPFGPLVVNGQKNSINIDDFVNYDTDKLSATYSAYRLKNSGNGKRLVFAPVNNDQQTVVGFAAFFLGPVPNDGKNVCAEYVGYMVDGVPGLPPGNSSGAYHIRLFR